MSAIVTRSQEPLSPATPLNTAGLSPDSPAAKSNRACDRCRRRKVKCHLPESGRCTQCQGARTACTFHLPAGKRGPKAKRRIHESSNDTIPTTATHDTLDLYMDDESSLPTADISVQEAVSLLGSIRHHHRHVPPADISVSDDPSTLPLWDQLVDEIAALGLDPHNTLNRCIDLFFEYLYPLTPLLHEPSFRNNLQHFIPGQHHIHQRHYSTSIVPTNPNATFALISAVCAEAAFLLPKDIFPDGEKVADILLQASRNSLDSYREADLEQPTASSITIRYFHSNCIHAAGRPKYSWHIFGEATRLAQAMRLHDESTYQHLDPIEAELRRRVFWIVYMGDKSAAILNDQPITMHKYSFESGITAAYPTGLDDDDCYRNTISSPTTSPVANEVLPQGASIMVGFNANIRLWQVASDLLLAVRVIREQRRNGNELTAAGAGADGTPQTTFSLTPAERYALDPLYVAFITCLDELPGFLQPGVFTIPNAADESSGAARKSTQFLVQCANLQISQHCLRMVMTQRFEELSYLTSGSQQADLQKTEIVREMLQFIRRVPFWALQVNGEPYVEKIRLVGVSLMEIIHRNSNSLITARARDDFGILLDILARLDSKASDALRSTSTNMV